MSRERPPAASRLRLRDRYHTLSQEAALMTIVGCDLHTRKQQVAVLHADTGEVVEQELLHAGDAVEQFYRTLPRPVIVGIESTGYALWFHELMQHLGHTLLVGEAAKIRAMVVRKTKTDRRDAQHLLDLLKHDRFPAVWIPDPATLDLLAWLEAHIAGLDARIAAAAAAHPGARLLLTHPGVGALTALTTVLVLGPTARFPGSKHVVSYVGLAPAVSASADTCHLGQITKQGSTLLRWVLGQAAPLAARADADLHRVYRTLIHRRGRPKARVAVARKLLVRLFIMVRDQIDYAEFRRRGCLSPPRETLLPRRA